ncbi:hypothetical protein [Streptomyces tateyamensis]|uniref:hypothetical protein n=1 Tax=Streptomyces tateyamensis TaxID=565073 RepID=UPI0015E8DE31|nr:hypothetical protein [Streptomyces tateyamensis]
MRPVGTPSTVALYLRCFPYDEKQMETHRLAAVRFAELWRLGRPLEFLDNGCAAGTERPALERLTAAVRLGVVCLLLVPGRFVFALDDEEALRIARRLTAAGCAVLELPLPTAAVEPEHYGIPPVSREVRMSNSNHLEHDHSWQ